MKLISHDGGVEVWSDEPPPPWMLWQDYTCLKIVLAILEAGTADGYPILADAIEEAGHPDPELPTELRRFGPAYHHLFGHYWPLESLLRDFQLYGLVELRRQSDRS